jgi:hypothetical protein
LLVVIVLPFGLAFILDLEVNCYIMYRLPIHIGSADNVYRLLQDLQQNIGVGISGGITRVLANEFLDFTGAIPAETFLAGVMTG